MGVPLRFCILGHLPYNIKKLTKKIFFHLYINGSTQERKFNFVKNILHGIISGST